MISFDKPYSREIFCGFLREFLPDDTNFFEKNVNIEKSFKSFKKITILGSNKKLKDLYIIEIEHNLSENSRSSLTREIFRFLSKNLYSNVLVISLNPSEVNYRFSLVLSDIEWKNEKSVKKVFSNPKRLSFVLGLNCKVHTPKKQLLTLGKIDDFSDLTIDLILKLFQRNFMRNIKIYTRI